MWRGNERKVLWQNHTILRTSSACGKKGVAAQPHQDVHWVREGYSSCLLYGFVGAVDVTSCGHCRWWFRRTRRSSRSAQRSTSCDADRQAKLSPLSTDALPGCNGPAFRGRNLRPSALYLESSG